MNDTLFIALIGFMSAIAGGVIQAWANRNFEARKIERQGRTEAYLAYLHGISELSFAREKSDRDKAHSKIAEARGRIALSGSAAVIAALVRSFDLGPDLHSATARKIHAQVVAAMRADCLAVPKYKNPDDLFVMLYGRSARDDRSSRDVDKETSNPLPGWYPLANATEAQIESWLVVGRPPYAEMRQALPWLSSENEFDAWLTGWREARQRGGNPLLPAVFDNVTAIPMPPHRTSGWKER